MLSHHRGSALSGSSRVRELEIWYAWYGYDDHTTIRQDSPFHVCTVYPDYLRILCQDCPYQLIYDVTDQSSRLPGEAHFHVSRSISAIEIRVLDNYCSLDSPLRNHSGPMLTFPSPSLPKVQSRSPPAECLQRASTRIHVIHTARRAGSSGKRCGTFRSAEAHPNSLIIATSWASFRSSTDVRGLAQLGSDMTGSRYTSRVGLDKPIP